MREREREMGRRACCAKQGLNRGAWSAKEDDILINYIHTHGPGKWRDLPQKAGLKRCGKSCRLRWLNYLRPDIKRGNISMEEEDLIIRLHKLLGNRWSLIAGRLPGRTDNQIKNYWNTYLNKRLQTNKVKDYGKQHGNLKEITDSHHHVIRTKAFRCKKVVIPCLLADDDHQMVDKNIVPGLACETPSSSGLGNSINTDFLKDFDINDLLVSEIALNSEFCEPKEININGERDKDVVDGENGLKSVSCFDFPVDETEFDDHYLMDQTIIRSENWWDTFEANHEVEMLDLNAFSSFL